jgi:hypothetical protein
MPTLTVNQIEGSKPQLVAGLVAGTTNEYQVLKVNADGSLSGAAGDKYLTSSTTSLAVTNGSKTLTVATGLAYTPTQAVTIVYDASNHMHATVTSYNSATGSMVVNVTSNTGSGTYALWTVNVGGIGSAAIPAAGTTGQVLTKVSGADYDDAWQTPAVAVGGITGLGTGVGAALAIAAGSAGGVTLSGGAGSFTTLNASGLTRIGTATTADAASDTLIGTSGNAQAGLTIQARASQTAALLRLVESTNNTTNNGWEFYQSTALLAQSGNRRYFAALGDFVPPQYNLSWSSSTSNVFASKTFAIGPTVAGSKILAIGNGTQFDTSGGISCAQIILDKTITASGTTGAQTINKTTGSVNFAAAASSLVVTNSLVTTSSVIICTVGTNDATMKSVQAVAAAGSFTIYPSASPTAETRVNFIVTN